MASLLAPPELVVVPLLPSKPGRLVLEVPHAAAQATRVATKTPEDQNVGRMSGIIPRDEVRRLPRSTTTLESVTWTSRDGAGAGLRRPASLHAPIRGSLPGVPRTLPAHTSRDFETELRELRAHLLAMGARCERIVGLAFEAFRRGAPEFPATLESLDAQIDRDEVEIHALIMRMLALRQPVADDLRFLATALRLITDLERIGDEAVNIGERTVPWAGDAHQLVDGELTSMAVAALNMLHDALEAFVRWDDEVAHPVLRCDDRVDQGLAAIICATTAHMSAHPADVPAGLRVIRVAKYLERIADHATNVAEEVIFMVRADDVRHGRWKSF
jgi:phosphate transport system protein